jgi:hypothetical protein
MLQLGVIENGKRLQVLQGAFPRIFGDDHPLLHDARLQSPEAAWGWFLKAWDFGVILAGFRINGLVFLGPLCSLPKTSSPYL